MKASKRKDVQAAVPSQLTDEEADFIWQRFCWLLRDAVSPSEFFRAHGRGVRVEAADRERARSFVRLFAQPDTDTREERQAAS